MDRDLIERYALDTRYHGLINDHQGIGRCEEPGCGDVLEVTLKTEREIITEIGYIITATACPPMKACAGIMAEMAMGKPVMAAYLITHADIGAHAGGLEKESEHCAMMAELALKRSIIDYARRRKQAQKQH